MTRLDSFQYQVVACDLFLNHSLTYSKTFEMSMTAKRTYLTEHKLTLEQEFSDQLSTI